VVTIQTARATNGIDAEQSGDAIPLGALVGKDVELLTDASREQVNTAINLGRSEGLAREAAGEWVPRLGKGAAAIGLRGHELIHSDGVRDRFRWAIHWLA
jgi:hypothetical protein